MTTNNYIGSINNYDIGGDKFNSSVYLVQPQISLITDNIAANSAVTISLNNILPNDGYNYEILLGYKSVLSNQDNKHVWLGVSSGTKLYANASLFSDELIYRMYARTSADFNQMASKWIAINNSDRNITVINFGSAISRQTNIKLLAIRRVPSMPTSGYISAVNGYKIGADRFDGQFIRANASFFVGRVMTANECGVYDLSNYLPNDDNDYMVDITAYGRTASSAGTWYWWTGTGTISAADVENKAFPMMASDYHIEKTYICSNSISIPIYANDRNITFAVTGTQKTTDNCGLYVLGYRRIGKNMNDYVYVPAEFVLEDGGSPLPFYLKYSDMLAIQKITTAGKYHINLYRKVSGSNPPILFQENANLMVYNDQTAAETAVANWSANISDFPPNKYTLITDLTDLSEVANYYRNSNISFQQSGIVKISNGTTGDPTITKIGELE